MLIPMALSRIVISEINNQQVMFLREVDGGREFSIVIGLFEASSLDRRARRVETPRPLTHDLLWQIIEVLEGELEAVLISRMEGSVYYALLRIRTGDRVEEIDARPSDAVAIAIRGNPSVPILVEEAVLEQSLAQQRG